MVLNGKEADDKALLAVHSKNHVNLIRNISSKKFHSRRDRIASKFNSIYFNDGSSEAAYLAAGSVVEVYICSVFGRWIWRSSNGPFLFNKYMTLVLLYKFESAIATANLSQIF